MTETVCRACGLGTTRGRGLIEALLGEDLDLPVQITPLSWLHGMLRACEDPRARNLLGDDDPESWVEMCAEVRLMLTRIEAALSGSVAIPHLRLVARP